MNLFSYVLYLVVLLANASPCYSRAESECNTWESNDEPKVEDGRSLLQWGVRKSSYQSHSPSSHWFGHHATRSEGVEELQAPGSDSETGLRKFWVIAISSYFLSGLFVIVVRWWFLAHKPMTPLSDSSSEEDDEDFPTNSCDSAHAIAKAAAKQEQSLAMVPPSWKNGTHEDRLQTAALTSFIISATMGVYACLRFFHRPDCAPFRPKVHIPEMFVLSGMIALTACCWMRPRSYLYWPALALILLYIPAVALPPFNLSCTTLQSQACRDSDHWRISQAINHVDCSLQGQTAQQTFLTMFLLLPWLLPEMKYLFLMIVWVFSVYIVWSVAYIRYSGDADKAFDSLDIVTRTVLLSFTLAAAVLKKFYVQKSQQNKYLYDVARRQDSLKLYNVLEFMLPEHVICKMLMEPGQPIAETIEEASILFIVIDDFEKIVRSKSPELLLKFLNKYFTQFDAICRYYGVQKIETVAEEYVCCVGATPSDIEESQSGGHGVVMSRLFKAASAILRLQTDEVKFKMGVHTGPIVAGVIAQKLPRYRLFGDTINTSARMMQKGEVGMLQFGEATRRYVPADVKCQPRGEIEMKGKGKVKTFLFSPPAMQSTVVTDSVTFACDSVCLGEEAAEGGSDAGGLLKVLLEPQEQFNSSEKEIPEKQPVKKPAPSVSQRQSQSVFQDVFSEITAETNRKAAGILSHSLRMKSRRWILNEQEGFTDDMEEEFRLNFHQQQTCKKIEQRLDILLLGIFILSVLEFLWNIPSPRHPEVGWAQNHDLIGTWARQPIFIGSKVLALSIIVFLRSVFTSKSGESVRHDPKWQTWLALSSCAIALALFVSYDVLITGGDPSNSDDRGVRVLAPFDQIFSLVFVLLFFFICSAHKVLFFQSLVFIPLALLLVCFTSIRSHCGIYFPVIGQVLFVVISISFSALAHSEEQSLRARYKAMHATKDIKERVETILKTMMPPMVLEQVQASLSSPATSVHHQYEMATIAQSDLCGFTKIASGLRPTEVVQFISELFGLFDQLTDKFGVYKVETVGDAYIGGQAEYPLTAQNSPSSVIQFGIAMISEVISWSKRRGVDVRCRVGVHHGSCIGGIVDKEMQRYHMFGKLMQVIEILESTAPAGSVQVSPACREAVLRERRDIGKVETPELQFQEREAEHLVTSKGEVHHFEETGGRTFVIQGQALHRAGGLREKQVLRRSKTHA